MIVISDDTQIELSAENELTTTQTFRKQSTKGMFLLNKTIISIGDVDMEDAFKTFDMEGVIDTDLTSVFVEDDDETVQLNYIVGEAQKNSTKTAKSMKV